MYSGRQPAITPLTAVAQTVTARLSGSTMPSTSSGLRSVKLRNCSIFSRVGGTIGRPSLHSLRIEVFVHLLEAAGEHDVARPAARPAARSRRAGRADCRSPVAAVTSRGVAAHLLRALRTGMAHNRRHRQIGHAEAHGGRRRLRQETLADQRRGRETGSLTRFTGPQHGGRARASARHAGDGGVDPEFPEALWQRGKQFLLVDRRGWSRTRAS